MFFRVLLDIRISIAWGQDPEFVIGCLCSDSNTPRCHLHRNYRRIVDPGVKQFMSHGLPRVENTFDFSYYSCSKYTSSMSRLEILA